MVKDIHKRATIYVFMDFYVKIGDMKYSYSDHGLLILHCSQTCHFDKVGKQNGTLWPFEHVWLQITTVDLTLLMPMKSYVIPNGLTLSCHIQDQSSVIIAAKTSYIQSNLPF